MASTPNLPSTPRLAYGALSAANTNRDGTGTIVDVLTGVAAGTRIDRVVIEATGTTTAGVVRLFLYDGSGYRLFYEQLVSAVTPSTSIAAARYEVGFTDLVLPSSSWKLAASTHNAETFAVFAHGADYT